jgi:hypothetical protein
MGRAYEQRTGIRLFSYVNYGLNISRISAKILGALFTCYIFINL